MVNDVMIGDPPEIKKNTHIDIPDTKSESQVKKSYLVYNEIN